MTNKAKAVMLNAAKRMVADADQVVKLASWEGRGDVDYEIALHPMDRRSAQISWMLIADYFMISLSYRCVWRSYEHILPAESVLDTQDRGLNWSISLVDRISRHGASFVALGSPARGPFRSTVAMVNDEIPKRPLTIKELWRPW